MTTSYDVIIIGGSYAGLSAALGLGRALKQVLVLDSGAPCNRQTPHSHNFLTHDGATPAAIAATARAEVQLYATVHFKKGIAIKGQANEEGFHIETAAGEHFQAKKLLFATGVVDEMPAIKGFAESWGISVLHCPYCHGYEVRNTPTGILANGEVAFEFARLISNWTKALTLFTNGIATLPAEQLEKISANRIAVNDKEILEITQVQGRIHQLIFKDGTWQSINVLYARPPFRQHCTIPETLGCQLTATGHIEVNLSQQTSVPGVFAAGDTTTPSRSLSVAVAAGTAAAATINRELVAAAFG
ncbi:thioredoxin reductase [Chitinophaga niastensis]|uniref:Thioredoxin reductase n=1 Tax=Chitinophaga niastensis TaxID=536980 RepID=A0A2P8HF37_CHINA|nr:NAD(P)/FAD-dependent oxidoreductase [Chitinophaga niastensis]PSL44839.1 thioredoxin reductase [Chitinophaga niastensis]